MTERNGANHPQTAAKGPEAASPSGCGPQALRPLCTSTAHGLPLYVQEQGARVIKTQDLLEVHLDRRKVAEARIAEISHVAIFGNVQVTTQALREMSRRGIPLTFFSSAGWFYAIAHGMPHGNVHLRIAQYAARDNPTRSLRVASRIVAAKTQNCRTILMRNHPAAPRRAVSELARLATAATAARSLHALRGIEGAATRIYFAHFQELLKQTSCDNPQPAFHFPGRNRRPPRDPINALLSFAYAMLAKDLTIATMVVGFDPCLGLYHAPRHGRPALALDLMEEFRPIIADSVVLTAVNKAILTPKDFTARDNAVALTPEARKRFIRAYERRLASTVTHPLLRQTITYRCLLEVQARLLARHLTGEIPHYPPFTVR